MNFAFELQKDKGVREGLLCQPYKILSVGEIMTAINFGKVVNSIEHLHKIVPPPQVPTGGMAPWTLPYYVPMSEYEVLKEEIDVVCEAMESLSFRQSLLTKAQKIREIIYNRSEKQDAETMSQAHPQMNAVWPKGEAAMIFQLGAITAWRDTIIKLKEAFSEELSTRLVMVLPAAKAGYFDGSFNIFPTTVREAFPSADYDMTEAGKCFALGRYTASVFHLMRILEVGLNVMGNNLGLTVASNWNRALNDIEAEIQNRSYATHPNWRTDESFYSEGAAHFRLIKNAWRNHTMHITEKYDEERAQDIINSVSAFMRHLATKIHE